MRLYSLLSRLFPGSFTAKVFGIAFVGIHVPLIAILAYVLAGTGARPLQWDVLGVLLAATLLGTAATLTALRLILAPLFRVESVMQRFEDTGVADPLPDQFRDEVGRLMQRTNRLMRHVGTRLDTTAREAETDALTGLLNRRGFDRRVAGAAQSLDGAAVLVIDVDRFKAVNDAHGHAEGDAVLRSVATAIRTTLRRCDVLARFGGDEFVCVLPDTDAALAVAAGERLRAAVAADVRVDGWPVTVTVGVAIRAQGDDLAAAIRAADDAACDAKAMGRDRTQSARRSRTQPGSVPAGSVSGNAISCTGAGGISDSQASTHAGFATPPRTVHRTMISSGS